MGFALPNGRAEKVDSRIIGWGAALTSHPTNERFANRVEPPSAVERTENEIDDVLGRRPFVCSLVSRRGQ